MSPESRQIAHPGADARGGEEEIDIRQVLALIWGGKFVVAVAIALSLLVGFLYLLSTPPIFQATGTVQVEKGRSSGGGLDDLGALFDAPAVTPAEIQILKSRMVLGTVVDNLQLEIDARPVYFPVFGAYIARKRASSDGRVSPPLFGMERFAWGGERLRVTQFDVPEGAKGKAFTVTALGDDRFALSDSDGADILQGAVGQTTLANTPAGPITLFVQDLRANVGARFSLVRRPLASALGALAGALTIEEAAKQSAVISITLEGPSPSYVSDVVTQIQDAYVRQNVERRSAFAEQSLEFLQKQLPEVKRKVDEAQAALNTYQVSQGSVNITKETDILLQQSVSFEGRKLELLNQRQGLLQRFTDQHPSVQTIDAQLASLNAEQQSIRKRTESLPETQQEILSLMRDLESNTHLYTTMLNSAQELQVTKAGTIGSVRVVDYPLPPRSKSKPKNILVLGICLIFGFVAGVAYLYLQQALFAGVSRPDEVERLFGLATYAAIPYADTQKRLATAIRRKGGGSNILAEVEADNVAVEALRSLRTALQFALIEAPNNIIMLTGPTPGVGKSFVAINLAAVLAKNGKTAVVVDCDMRRGHLHKHVGQLATPGLSDFVVGKADLESVLRTTTVRDLTLITNGTMPPNPAELLLHERFRELLNQLSARFDFVVLDTPPVLPVADASIIGPLAGCVLVALKEGAHTMHMIEETLRRLRQAGVQVRGTIFNQVGARSGGGYGYGYYYSTYRDAYKQKYSSES